MLNRRNALWHAAAMVLLVAGGMGARCTPPVPRPIGSDEGSARWAFAIAEPQITAFAPDVELREILGAAVALDGRLPSNTGDWSFVAYSASKAKVLQVTVSFDGAPSTTERAESPPGPGIVRPLPAGWANSTTVFQATNGKRDPAASVGQLVVLNIASYSGAPNQAVWAINFNAGANQLVRFDGSYIGPE